MISVKKKMIRKYISSILSLLFMITIVISPMGVTLTAKAGTFTPPKAVTDHLNQDDWANIQSILSGIYGSVTSPLKISDLDKGSYTTGQLLGNGDIGAIAAGVSTTSQQFYFGKNDFWGTLHAQGSSVKDNQGILSGGGLDIWPTTAAGTNAASTFNMKQDLLNAQIITNMQLKDNSGNDANIQMNSWIADKDNVFVTEITNNSTGGAITLNTKQWVPASAYANSSATDLTDAINTYPYTGGIDTSNTNNPVLWTTRDTNAGTNSTSNFRSRMATATTVVGAPITNALEKIEKNDYYDSNKGKYYNSLGESGDFTVPAGGTVDVVTYITSSSGNYNTIKDVSEVQQAAVSGLAAYTTQNAINQLKTDHLNWWKNYWLKSYVQFNDSAINQYYYGSLFIEGCANRAPAAGSKVNQQDLPGSMYGPWVPADNVGWGGRYFLNYNQEAEYYAAGSTNRIDTAKPYDDVMNYELPWNQNNAAAQGHDGAVWNRTLSPFDFMSNPQPSLNSKSSTKMYGFSSGSTDQKSNGMFAAVPMVFYYEYTLDNNYLQNVLYPHLKQLLTFYSSYVLKTDDGNGQYHYSVLGSSIHEGDAADNNPDLDIGAIKFMAGFLVDHAAQMNEDPGNIGRWKDLRDHTSFPEAMLPQGIFSANNNGNFVPTLTATDYQSPNQPHVDMIEPGDQPVELEGVVFPIENVQVLDGNKELLQKINNTITYMNAWSASGFAGWSSQNNGFCKIYPIAARAGYPAADLLSKFKTALASKVRTSNLSYYGSGGAIETIGAMEGLDSMLMQSSTTSSMPSTIMVFPNWDTTRSVDYERLGAMGNVEVSSSYDASTQTIPYVDLTSRRDGKIALVNPWTVGTPVIQVVNSNNTLGAAVNYTINGGKIIFDAQNGTRYMVMNDTNDTTNHVSGITFNKYSGTLIYNGSNGSDTTTISAIIAGNPNDTLKWTSSDNSIVTVTDNGNNLVTLKAAGTGSDKVANANVTATSTQDPGISQTYTVKVADATTVPASLTMVSPDAATIYGPASTDPSTDKVSGNDRLQLTASILPANAYDKRIMWTSSNQNVAMVDKNGLVIARGLGTVTITGTSMANPSLPPVSCTVTVIASGNDYSADATLASVINAAKSISVYTSNTTGSGGFKQVSSNPNWEGQQEGFQRSYINALGVKAKYSGYATCNISKDTAYFAAVALNEAIKTIDPSIALTISNVADKTALIAAINNAKPLTSSNFNTTQDWTDLQNALTTAQDVNIDPAALQSAVDNSVSALIAAMSKVVQTGGSIPNVYLTTSSAVIYGGHLAQMITSTSGIAWSVKNADGSSTSNAVIDPNGGLLMANVEGIYKVTAKPGSGASMSKLVTFANMSLMPNLTANGNGNGSAFGSTSGGSYPPTNVFDGSTSTFYDHSTTVPYVGWDFGSGNKKVINVMKFIPRSGSNAARATGAILQGSNDKTNYTDLYTVTDTFPTSGTLPWYVKAINNTTAYRYYRWLGLNGTHANVAEILLYLNVDKTALGNELAFAQSQLEGNYTDDSWQVLQDALIDATADLNNQNAAQAQIDASAADLQAAISGLQPSADGALVVANGITSVNAPAKDAASLTLPAVSDGFTIAVKASDNPVIIGLDGSIIPPETDTTVNLTLEVTRTSDGLLADTINIPVNVPAATYTTTGVAIGITTITAPVKDATSLTLPIVPTGFTVTINNSDNTNVITTGGAITPPEVDTTVNLVLKITRTVLGTTATTASIPVNVPAGTSSGEVAAGITYIPAPAKDETSLTLPAVPTGFTVIISSSDNTNVITTGGAITPPDNDTTVNLVFTVTKIATGSTTTTSAISVNVPAGTTASEIAAGITSIPAPLKDATSLILPAVPSGFIIAINSTSNSAIITTGGGITLPSVDTTVNIVLSITRTLTGTTANTISIPVVVPSSTAADIAAANAVNDAITALPSLDNIVLGDKADVDGVNTLFKNLTSDQKQLVSAENQAKLTSELNKIAALKADQKAADAVNSDIAGLPAAENVALSDESTINLVNYEFSNLTGDQQKLISDENKNKLSSVTDQLNKLIAAETEAEKQAADQAAADAVNNAIASLPALENVTLSDESAISYVNTRFGSLTTAQQQLVSIDNNNKLNAELSLLTALKADEAKADLVNDMISGLPDVATITLSNEAVINAANAAFNSLTPNQKSFVTSDMQAKLNIELGKIAALKDKIAADAVNTIISSLPAAANATLINIDAINGAKMSYDNLTVAQKAFITNVNQTKFNDLLAKLPQLISDKAATDDVNTKISELPPAANVTLNNQIAINAANTAYNNLTAELKSFISADNAALLSAVMTKLSELIDAANRTANTGNSAAQAKTAADRTAAGNVSTTIAALPSASSLNLDDEAAINAALTALNGLTADQKALLSASDNAKLNALLSQLETLKADAKAAADKAAADKAAADKAAADKAAADKAAADKAAVDKAAADKAAADKAAADKAAADKAAADKAAADKAAADKAAADKSAAAKAAAVKAAADKAAAIIKAATAKAAADKTAADKKAAAIIKAAADKAAAAKAAAAHKPAAVRKAIEKKVAVDLKAAQQKAATLKKAAAVKTTTDKKAAAAKAAALKKAAANKK